MMRAKEFVLEKKKKKKRKAKYAVYGPGPYGWYGFNPGYSGEYDSGEGGGDGGVGEGWSDKYKRSINCASPKGFSQRAHCQGRKKTEEQELAENNPAMDQKQGTQWEQELMRSWAPKAAAYMAKVVKNSFNSLYPDVPIRIRREDIMIMATTDPKTRFSELDIDVFNMRDNPNWECSFVVSPLYYMEDNTRYLELMVDDAASGQYKGVWKLIAREWAQYANSQLQKTSAKAAVFSVDEDHSDAWAAIAAQAGLKFISHN